MTESGVPIWGVTCGINGTYFGMTELRPISLILPVSRAGGLRSIVLGPKIFILGCLGLGWGFLFV